MLGQDGGSGTLKQNGFGSSSQAATFPRISSTHAQRKSILRPPSIATQGPEAGPSSLLNPSPPVTPTRTRTFRTSLRQPSRASSEPTLMKVPETPTNNKGKRKAPATKPYSQCYRIPKIQPDAMENVFKMTTTMIELQKKEKARLKYQK